jgi:hypothetical protein
MNGLTGTESLSTHQGRPHHTNVPRSHTLAASRDQAGRESLSDPPQGPCLERHTRDLRCTCSGNVSFAAGEVVQDYSPSDLRVRVAEQAYARQMDDSWAETTHQT